MLLRNCKNYQCSKLYPHFTPIHKGKLIIRIFMLSYLYVGLNRNRDIFDNFISS